jgi:hypothetical protein
MLSFLEKIRQTPQNGDPWRLRLERVHGKIDFFDNLERISSQTLLDLLEVPQRNRTAGTFRRLSKLMTELGWTAVRVRDLTRGGYKEQVRGYCRDSRSLQPSHWSLFTLSQQHRRNLLPTQDVIRWATYLGDRFWKLPVRAVTHQMFRYSGSRNDLRWNDDWFLNLEEERKSLGEAMKSVVDPLRKSPPVWSGKAAKLA